MRGPHSHGPADQDDRRRRSQRKPIGGHLPAVTARGRAVLQRSLARERH